MKRMVRIIIFGVLVFGITLTCVLGMNHTPALAGGCYSKLCPEPQPEIDYNPPGSEIVIPPANQGQGGNQGQGANQGGNQGQGVNQGGNQGQGANQGGNQGQGGNTNASTNDTDN
ncbi:MAG: hypothetical protein Fur0025_44170 [Oscillatoriaceae cyanobacterium]